MEERTITLPLHEVRALVALLLQAANHFSKHIYEDVDFARLVPDVQARRQLMAAYHAFNGDPETAQDDQSRGEEYRYSHYSMLLHFFAHRLAPDIEKELRNTSLAHE